MMTVVCCGYRDSKDNAVQCGKVLGQKEGPDGEVSHTYCDVCFQLQMDAVFDHLQNLKAIHRAGTLDIGDTIEFKIARARAIGLAKSHYGPTLAEERQMCNCQTCLLRRGNVNR